MLLAHVLYISLDICLPSLLGRQDCYKGSEEATVCMDVVDLNESDLSHENSTLVVKG